MVTEQTDANTEEQSSTSSDVNGQDSSTAQQAEQQSSVETPEVATESTEVTATEEQAEVTAEEQTETVQEEEVVAEVVEKTIDKPEDDKLPFNTHPRFKELVTEKNQYRQTVEQSKPLVEQATVTNEFLRDNRISPQEYQSALQYLALLRTDPMQAYAMLKPTYDQLALLSGEKLPADLQTEVAAGALAQERAVEIAKARASQQHQAWRGQQQQQVQQVDQTQVVGSTIQAWAGTKQSADPDFKPGTALWEQVDLRIKSAPPFRSAQDAMQGSEKAYTEAKAFLARMQPRTPIATKKPLQSRNMASTNNVVVKTAADVAKAISAGMKPHQMRYS